MEEKDELTTITIYRSTKGLLDKRKVHHRQSYDEVIGELLKAKTRCECHEETDD